MLLITLFTFCLTVLAVLSDLLHVHDWWAKHGWSSAFTADWYLKKGVEAFEKPVPDLKDAEHCLARALAADPRLGDAKYYLGMIRVHQNRDNEALDLLSGVSRRDRTFKQSLQAKALLLSERTEREPLREAVKQLLELDEEDVLGRLLKTCAMIAERAPGLEQEYLKNIQMFKRTESGLTAFNRLTGVFTRTLTGSETNVLLGTLELPTMFYCQMLLFVSLCELSASERVNSRDATALLDTAFALPLPLRKAGDKLVFENEKGPIYQRKPVDIQVVNLTFQNATKGVGLKLISFDSIEQGVAVHYSFGPLGGAESDQHEVGIGQFFIAQNYLKSVLQRRRLLLEGKP